MLSYKTFADLSSNHFFAVDDFTGCRLFDEGERSGTFRNISPTKQILTMKGKKDIENPGLICFRCENPSYFAADCPNPLRKSRRKRGQRDRIRWKNFLQRKKSKSVQNSVSQNEIENVNTNILFKKHNQKHGTETENDTGSIQRQKKQNKKRLQTFLKKKLGQTKATENFKNSNEEEYSDAKVEENSNAKKRRRSTSTLEFDVKGIFGYKKRKTSSDESTVENSVVKLKKFFVRNREAVEIIDESDIVPDIIGSTSAPRNKIPQSKSLNILRENTPFGKNHSPDVCCTDTAYRSSDDEKALIAQLRQEISVLFKELEEMVKSI